MNTNTTTTRTGKIRAVCQWCDRQSRPVEAFDGRPDMWTLKRWSCSPFPDDYQHKDGSFGAQYTCPTCRQMADERRRLGIQPLLTPTPTRAAATRAAPS